MTKPQAVSSHEYKNDYLYIVIRQMPERGPNTWLYCCGINTTRFDPICWGKAGICSNPAFKGLQQMRADTSAFALTNGFTSRPADGIDCTLVTPEGDGWYREAMFIDNASSNNISKTLEFSVLDLVKTVLYVCAPDAKIPSPLPGSGDLQKWLDSYNVQNYVQAAPPPIARKRDQK
ncbi:MAG TPA: hypothetical protein VK654_05600 [Nitrospirota bacterium]|nr:hypothetical protein [Nitrospirota bacterium]